MSKLSYTQQLRLMIGVGDEIIWSFFFIGLADHV
ncbi:MAG: hypothetical protein ACI9QV_001152 [Methylophagaceae bacterium]|jgi:hypothetical protein